MQKRVGLEKAAAAHTRIARSLGQHHCVRTVACTHMYTALTVEASRHCSHHYLGNTYSSHVKYPRRANNDSHSQFLISSESATAGSNSPGLVLRGSDLGGKLPQLEYCSTGEPTGTEVVQ